MSEKSKYTLEAATTKLEQNGIKVDPTNKTITFGIDPPGLGLLGSVDYLIHYQGYRVA